MFTQWIQMLLVLKKNWGGGVCFVFLSFLNMAFSDQHLLRLTQWNGME